MPSAGGESNGFARIPPNPPSDAKAGITFLHGWAMHGGLFRPLFDELAGGLSCRRIDLPGHGLNRESEWPDAAEDWIAGQVPKGGWLAGWSLGGTLAMQTALRHRDHFSGLILIAATPCFLRRPHWPHGVSPDQLEALGDELASDPSAVINRFLALEVQGDRDAAAQLRLLRKEALKHGPPDPRALRTGLDLLRDVDLTGRLEAIDLPVLLLGGRRDRLVSWPTLEATAEKLPRAKLTRIPGAAHAPFLTRASAVARTIESFMLAPCASQTKRPDCHGH